MSTISGSNIAVFVAITAFAIGISELMLVAQIRTVRCWGRALKLGVPLLAGYVAMLLAIDPGTNIDANDV
jgi:hypothetical protein